MPCPAEAIPSFTLYGDPEDPEAVALMHIETIAARSTLYDWEISAHRHSQSVQVLLVQKGQAVAQLDGRPLVLEPPCFVCIPQATVHGFRFDPGTSGFVITLSADCLMRLTEGSDPLLFLLTSGGHASLSASVVERTSWLANELLRLSQSWPFDQRLAGCLFEALLRSLPTEGDSSPLDPRLTEFMRLLERHVSEHRPVSFYADRIGISPRSLTRLCARHFGHGPQQAISRRLAAEAKRMLRYTNANVVQTSDALGFKDPSYFSRFYHRTIGHRPTADKRAVVPEVVSGDPDRKTLSRSTRPSARP